MKIITPKAELLNAPSYSSLLALVEQAGRTCYKSEDKITANSAEKFIAGIIKRGHEAVIEHGSLSRPGSLATGACLMRLFVTGWRRTVRSLPATVTTPRRASAARSR